MCKAGREPGDNHDHQSQGEMVPANLAQLEHIIRYYKTFIKNKLNNNNNYLSEKRAMSTPVLTPAMPPIGTLPAMFNTGTPPTRNLAIGVILLPMPPTWGQPIPVGQPTYTSSYPSNYQTMGNSNMYPPPNQYSHQGATMLSHASSGSSAAMSMHQPVKIYILG